MEKKVDLTQGEKLILLMMCEIQEHLKMDGEVDTKLIKSAILTGNLWGLSWGLSGVFHDTETPGEVVSETVNILLMWRRLEESFENLSQTDKEWLAEKAKPFGKTVKFSGFDGNNESSHISAASFLINSLDRFPNFKGRDLDAHMPTLAAHRRMLTAFEPILQEVTNQDFNAAQISEVVTARSHSKGDHQISFPT